MLAADRITVRRGRRLVVDRFTVAFPIGVTVLLGPNGAGKTTLMHALCGLLGMDDGDVTWQGRSTRRGADLVEFRRGLGWMPQDPRFPPRLRVDRFLEVAGWLKSMDAAERSAAVSRVLAEVDLEGFGHRRSGRLSGGESQRLALATALIAQPRVVILDEPTAGLDPDQRASVHRMLRSLARDRVVLLSTHLLEDVEGVADRVVVVDRGRRLFAGSLAEFVARAGADLVGLDSLRRAWSAVLASAGADPGAA